MGQARTFDGSLPVCEEERGRSSGLRGGNKFKFVTLTSMILLVFFSKDWDSFRPCLDVAWDNAWTLS